MAEECVIFTRTASGVGLQLTNHLLGKGWKIAMTDINNAGEAIPREFGHDVLWVQSDISDSKSQLAMFRKG